MLQISLLLKFVTDSLSNSVMIIIGAPGSGKSTTVAKSGLNHGYMRVRVTEQTGAMATLQRTAAELCASLSKSGYMTREVLEAKLVSCCEQAVATLFSQFQARASILRVTFLSQRERERERERERRLTRCFPILTRRHK